MKKNNSNSGSSGFTTALLLGLAAGAMLGVLFAPDKGSDIRARLKFKLSNYRDQLTELHAAFEARKESVLQSDEVAESKAAAEKLVAEIEGLIGKIQSGKA